MVGWVVGCGSWVVGGVVGGVIVKKKGEGADGMGWDGVRLSHC